MVLLVAGAIAREAAGNDGRDRYHPAYPALLYHLQDALAPGAGFRVLAGDRAGGADGDPAFRWAQAHAIDVVQIAARRTEERLGPARFPMAIFDLSAENGDTPIDFGAVPTGRVAPQAPRGRHPGGSHDGGLNLDLGYYLRSIEGRVLAEDYAACTEHYLPGEVDAGGQPRDAYMCIGPADRLDVERQAFFVWTLLQMHRGRFRGRLLDEVGMDKAVLDAVRGQLVAWREEGRFKITARHLRDLDAVVNHDRWEGWQRYHHHHLHLRLQPFSPTGPMRDAVRAAALAARRIRADVQEPSRPDAPVLLDARLKSYDLERAVEVHLLPRLGSKARITRVRYRLGASEWQAPDDAADDFRYTFDLPPGLQAQAGRVTVEAEVALDDGWRQIIAADVALPRQDPRLHLAYRPGEIDGSATLRGGSLSAQMSFPPRLRPLVTSVRYLLYPATGGPPEVHTVDAGWFAPPEPAAVPEQGSRSRSDRPGLPLQLRRRKADPALALVEAELLLSGRYTVRVPLYLEGG